MSLGFLNLNSKPKLKSILSIDMDKNSVYSCNSNFGDHGICGNIENIIQEIEIPKADIVIGGPPCQGFSLLNKNRRGDRRRELWRPYLDVVERCRASMFVIENVKELYKSNEYDDILSRALNLNFNVASRVLNAADYGVPQTRLRTFIIGVKNTLNIDIDSVIPKKSHSEHGNNGPKWRSVHDAISDLPKPLGTEINDCAPPLNLHFGRKPTEKSLLRYRLIPEGGNRFDLAGQAPELTPRCRLNKRSGSADLFGRLWRDRPSVTIRTEFLKPGKGRYPRPDQDRPITHREAARLMSFPDGFRFSGGKIDIARQIGNAVPPLPAQNMASPLLNSL
jgi:DNA (cytosine-5)-methyltransferase 1